MKGPLNYCYTKLDIHHFHAHGIDVRTTLNECHALENVSGEILEPACMQCISLQRDFN